MVRHSPESEIVHQERSHHASIGEYLAEDHSERETRSDSILHMVRNAHESEIVLQIKSSLPMYLENHPFQRTSRYVLDPSVRICRPYGSTLPSVRDCSPKGSSCWHRVLSQTDVVTNHSQGINHKPIVALDCHARTPWELSLRCPRAGIRLPEGNRQQNYVRGIVSLYSPELVLSSMSRCQTGQAYHNF